VIPAGKASALPRPPSPDREEGKGRRDEGREEGRVRKGDKEGEGGKGKREFHHL